MEKTPVSLSPGGTERSSEAVPAWVGSVDKTSCVGSSDLRCTVMPPDGAGTSRCTWGGQPPARWRPAPISCTKPAGQKEVLGLRLGRLRRGKSTVTSVVPGSKPGADADTVAVSV